MANFSRHGLPRRGSGRNLSTLERQADLENLLVFGYQCKLFRDDERATLIDEGRHLIPWMGDASLMIDRYDGRGHLHDLKPYDAEFVSSNHHTVPEDEKVVEAACDEQRYLELNSQYLEQVMYEEEEMKRLQQSLDDGGYGAVGFSYEPPSVSQQSDDKSNSDEEDEPYTPSEELQVPQGMLVPHSVKCNAVIEKTANFISKHGTQMEIMIKTKQKDNPQFNFLNFGDPWNAYYKHVVKMIKLGRYKTKADKPKDDDLGDQYLHPSLVKTSTSSAPTMSLTSSKEFLKIVRDNLPAGQIANTPYAKLLRNLSKHTGRNSPAADPIYSLPQASSEMDPASYEPSSHTCTANQPGPSYPQQAYGYDGSTNELPPVPGTEPITLPPSHLTEPPPPGVEPTKPTSLDTKSSKQLSHGSAHSIPAKQSVVTDLPHGLKAPPLDIRPIVDKMANYVAKNGPEFEIIVRAKKDERFQFLNKNHIYHRYYCYKRDLYIKENPNHKASDSHTNKLDKGDSRAVTFKVRSKDMESSSLVSRPALLGESSDEEDSDGVVRRDYLSEALQSASDQSVLPPAEPVHPFTTPVGPATGSAVDDAAAERKAASERLKDKLASAAREKLTQANKEKQLQAERKRKAAMFISLLKSQPASSDSVDQETAESGEGGWCDSQLQASPCVEVSEDSQGWVVEADDGPGPVPDPVPSSPRPHSPAERVRSRLSTPVLISKSRSRSPPLRRRSPGPSRRRRKSRSRSPSHRKRPRRSRSRSRTRGRKSPSHAHTHLRTHGKRSKRSPPRRSRSKSKSKHRRKSRSRSPRSKPKKSKSHRRSRSKEKKVRSRSRSSSSDVKIIKAENVRAVGGPVDLAQPGSPERVDSKSDKIYDGTLIEIKHDENETTSVSNDMLSKVRAMLKASREAVLSEEGGGTSP